VYALAQRNGWVWVVAGAFETRTQADSYSEKIRASGHQADVVLRQGRMF
jgi:cell division protein FtsN